MSAVTKAQDKGIIPPWNEYENLTADGLGSIINGLYQKIVINREWVDENGQRITKDGKFKRLFLYIVAYIDIFDIFKIRTAGKTHQFALCGLHIDDMFRDVVKDKEKAKQISSEIIYKYIVLNHRVSHVGETSAYKKIDQQIVNAFGSETSYVIQYLRSQLTGNADILLSEMKKDDRCQALYEGITKANEIMIKLIQENFVSSLRS